LFVGEEEKKGDQYLNPYYPLMKVRRLTGPNPKFDYGQANPAIDSSSK
jgi:hypothetical protein